jgi:hypothetical protein
MLIIGKSNKENYMRIVKVILIFLVLLISCQSPKDKAKDEEKFSWNAGISAPKNYTYGAPFVEYSYQGKGIGGASANIASAQGWGITSGSYTGGDKFTPVPDSVFVKWRCGFDLINYEGGFKLPRKKILELFSKGIIDPFSGRKEDYTVLAAGMAPGGNVTIWMQASGINTEIVKFKAKKISQDGRYDPHTVTLWSSKGYEAKDILKYINFHGVPYEIWEIGEKVYDYDIVFSNEDELINYDRRITGYSKDGSLISSNSDKTSFATLEWDKKFDARDNSKKYKNKLPVHIFVQRSTKDNKQWCDAEIVLPNNFETVFNKAYIDTKTSKREHYNRIIIGLDKEDKDLPYLMGHIWISGQNRQKEIMRFRAVKFDTISRKFLVSKYSIPKGFIFPKWEKGKEPLSKPDVDYWQEQ